MQRVQQMSKLQLGVGVPNGNEQVIHTVQLGMQLHPNLNFPENGTRPDLLFVGIQERQILGDVLITEPCCKTLTRHQAVSRIKAIPRESSSSRDGSLG